MREMAWAVSGLLIDGNERLERGSSRQGLCGM